MPDTYRLNGTAHPWQAGLTVEQTIEDAGLEGTWFAVAVDGAVVPATRWPLAEVPNGAEVEVLQPCQGG